MTRGQLRQKEVQCEARYPAALMEFKYLFAYFSCGWRLSFIHGTLFWRFLECHMWSIKPLIIPELTFSPITNLVLSLENTMCESYSILMFCLYLEDGLGRQVYFWLS